MPTITKVQRGQGTSSTTSVNASLPSLPTTNNLIIAVIGSNVSASNFTINSSLAGSSWTLLKSQNTPTANGIAIYAHIVTSGEGTTYTAGASGATTMFLAVYELTGNSLIITDNIPSANSGTSTLGTADFSLKTATITPTSSRSAFAIAGIWWAGGTATGVTVNNSYTLFTSGTNRAATAELAIASTSGTYDTTFTWTNSTRTASTVYVVVQESPTLTIGVSDTQTVSDDPPSAGATIFTDGFILSSTEYLTVTDIPSNYDDLIFVADQATIQLVLYEGADRFFAWFG